MADQTGLLPVVQLRSGPTMPVMGLGTWSMTDDEAHAAVGQALELGYRLVDTAKWYDNEAGVGRAVRESGLARGSVFVTTKLPGDGHGVREAQDVFAGSLERLGLDYVDLYMIHWPLPHQDRYVDAWRGLIELREQGLVKSIGVSNFKPAHIDRIVAETGVWPDVNQIQLNPYVMRGAAQAYHAEHEVVTQSWSPLGKGVHAELTESAGDTSGIGPLDEPVIAEIAEAHGRNLGQIVLRWHLEQGLAVVVKSTNAARLAGNLDILDFELTPEERAAISALDRGEEAAADSDGVGVGG